MKTTILGDIMHVVLLLNVQSKFVQYFLVTLLSLLPFGHDHSLPKVGRPALLHLPMKMITKIIQKTFLYESMTGYEKLIFWYDGR